MRWVVVALAASSGCYSPSAPQGAPCDDGQPCPNAQTCVVGFCTTESSTSDASLDGLAADSPDACATTCRGGTLESCAGPVACPDGCIEQPEAHCGRIVPSNVAWDVVADGVGPLEVTVSSTFDTDTGMVVAGGPLVNITNTTVGPYRVLGVSALTLAADVTVTVTGSRPLILLVTGDVRIDGTIVLAAGCAGAFDPTCAGPGGGIGASAAIAATGCGPGGNGDENTAGNGMFSESGGGGGGFGTAGGFSAGTTVGLGPGGLACGTATLDPLIGGSGGGGGSVQAGTIIGGRGGGGGGAIQITAAGALELAGAIDASGAGGENGYVSGMTPGGGGGGGAGGAVLLEGSRVTIIGTVAANGGGGGGNHTTIAAGHGQPGPRDATCAAGGMTSNSLGGQPGETGGCKTALPGDGPGIAVQGDRGGGGGAVGRIRINAIVPAIDPGATISPDPTSATPIVE